MVNGTIYPLIGISGASRAGKDTLCSTLTYLFKQNKINAKRFSIAGDFIKKDLHKVIKSRTNISTFTLNDKEKEVIRPILVEYGRLMRRITQGRYFINQLKNNKTFVNKNVRIITDIRYIEYPKDELFWLKKEEKGFLIFIERENVKDANVFEKKNNSIIKKSADYVVKMKNFKNKNLLKKEMEKEAKKIIQLYFKKYKLPFSNRTTLCS
jgi:phosphoribulokinase